MNKVICLNCTENEIIESHHFAMLKLDTKTISGIAGNQPFTWYAIQRQTVNDAAAVTTAGSTRGRYLIYNIHHMPTRNYPRHQARTSTSKSSLMDSQLQTYYQQPTSTKGSQVNSTRSSHSVHRNLNIDIPPRRQVARHSQHPYQQQVYSPSINGRSDFQHRSTLVHHDIITSKSDSHHLYIALFSNNTLYKFKYSQRQEYPQIIKEYINKRLCIKFNKFYCATIRDLRKPYKRSCGECLHSYDTIRV